MRMTYLDVKELGVNETEFLGEDEIIDLVKDNFDSRLELLEPEMPISFPVKNKKRAKRRHNDYKKAIRKRNININKPILTGDRLLYDNLHQYADNKIHRSCLLGTFSEKAHSDLIREDTMKEKELEYIFSKEENNISA